MDIKFQIKLILFSLVVVTSIFPAFSSMAHSPDGTQHNESHYLTIIVDILNESGRLWGLYVEPATAYFQAKAIDSYKNFDKQMDHVTIYQVVQLTLKPGEYVIALHDSHAHQEPGTNFNLFVVTGIVGVETIILPITATSQQSAPSFDLLTSLSLISIVSVLKIMKKKKYHFWCKK